MLLQEGLETGRPRVGSGGIGSQQSFPCAAPEVGVQPSVLRVGVKLLKLKEPTERTPQGHLGQPGSGWDPSLHLSHSHLMYNPNPLSSSSDMGVAEHPHQW